MNLVCTFVSHTMLVYTGLLSQFTHIVQVTTYKSQSRSHVVVMRALTFLLPRGREIAVMLMKKTCTDWKMIENHDWV